MAAKTVAEHDRTAAAGSGMRDCIAGRQYDPHEALAELLGVRRTAALELALIEG